MRTAELAADVAFGHNQPPPLDLTESLDPVRLANFLEREYETHRKTATDLRERYENFLIRTKNGIEDEHIAGVTTDFKEQIETGISDTDVTREKIKKPVLTAQRLIDGEAKKIKDSLEVLLPIVKQRLAAFLAAKAERERREAEQEAQRLAAAAQDAMRAADMDGAEEFAIEALQAAQEAEARATASLPELSRVRSVHNSVAGLSDNWEYGITHPDLVPRQFLMVNDAAVKLAIKQGAREIPGLSIFNSPRLYSRKGR